MEKGLLASATQWSEEEEIIPKEDSLEVLPDENSTSINLIFGTGVTYLNYLWTKSLHFVVHEDLEAVQTLHNKIFGRNSKTLFFSSLKILSSPVTKKSLPGKIQNVEENSTPDISNKDISVENPSLKNGQHSPINNLDVSLLHIPRHPAGVEIRPFHMTSQSLVPQIHGPEDKTRIGSLRDLHLAAFQSITGVDSRCRRIRAVVVFNVCEMIHVLRQVLQDFGPFPIIGCDSESLSWLFGREESGERNFEKNSSGELLGKMPI